VLPFTGQLVGAKRTQQGSRLRRFSSEIPSVAMLTLSSRRKAALGDDRNCEGGPRSPESLARGMFPNGFPRNPGELAISACESGNMDARETVGVRPRMDEQSYEPYVPVKVGNRRASERSARTHWREGGTDARIWRKET